MRRTLLLGIVGAALLAVGAGMLRHRNAQAPASVPEPTVSLSHAEPTAHAPEPKPEAGPLVAGLDLLHIALAEGAATARADAGTAQLTIDPALQREALGLLEAHHLPEAAVVLMDVATGELIA